MKLILTKEQIIKGLQKAANITSQKSGTTFLKAVWLRWDKNKLEIMATDSKIEFMGEYEIAGEGSGLIGVNGKSFYELIKKLPPGEIILTYNDSNECIVLEQGLRKYNIRTYESSWFREFVKFPENGYIKWYGDKLKEIINRLYYFVPDEIDSETRYLVLKKYDETNKIVSYALLIHSFAMIVFEQPDLYNLLDENTYLIDKIFLNEIKKWLENNEIFITIDNNRIFIKDIENNEKISFPILTKEIPDYLPFLEPFKSKNINTLIVNKNEIIDVLDRLYIFVSDIDEIVKFVFDDNELILHAESLEKGEATESLIVEFNGDLDESSFLIKRMKDIIEHFYSDKIKIEFTHKEGPCKITGLDEVDEGYLIITMPMRVKEEIYYEEEEVE